MDIEEPDIRRLDGRLLLVFRELARRRRTTEAARRLGITQSTVSHALGRLRELFGDPLFVRRPHGLEPTPRALELAPRIEALIDMAGTVMARGGFDPARSERCFRLAAAEFVLALIGGPLIQALRRAAPRASFTVDFLQGAATLAALERGEFDLAIGEFLRLPAGVETEPLYRDRYCVVARRRHPTIRGSIDERTYRTAANIFVGRSGETGITAATLPDPKIVSTVALVPRWLTALTMVATSDAIATCPRRLAERMAPGLGLQVIEYAAAGPRFTVSAVRRAGDTDAGINWLRTAIRGAVPS
ncbi:MAG TPA: LysR substrate-binding domain-containing protein [Reyranella sp.]|nr:LysR substrate-binding domain-containing protein [Reyranella sp.]